MYIGACVREWTITPVCVPIPDPLAIGPVRSAVVVEPLTNPVPAGPEIVPTPEPEPELVPVLA